MTWVQDKNLAVSHWKKINNENETLVWHWFLSVYFVTTSPEKQQ